LQGFKFYEKAYSKKVKVESYELNPMFKKSVKKRRYSFRHLFSMIIVSVFLYLIHYFGTNDMLGFRMGTFFLIQGMLFSMLIYINSRHIQNIILFSYIEKNPSVLSGKVKYSYKFSLKASSAGLVGIFIVLFAVFLFVPSFFTFGFALGPLIMLIKQKFWLMGYDEKKKK
jgi:hypothetical protein